MLEPASTLAHQPDQGRLRVLHAEDLVWKPFAAFPVSARIAVLVGDPSTSAPYVIRVRLPAGVRMMPHRHSEDRVYTVISGVFYIGIGEPFDEWPRSSKPSTRPSPTAWASACP